jgi:hypothetical protein
MSRSAATRRAASRAPHRLIPLDDEPLTPREMRTIEEGRAAFARGDYCTLEEAKAYVARLRRKARAPKARPRPRA